MSALDLKDAYSELIKPNEFDPNQESVYKKWFESIDELKCGRIN